TSRGERVACCAVVAPGVDTPCARAVRVTAGPATTMRASMSMDSAARLGRITAFSLSGGEGVSPTIRAKRPGRYRAPNASAPTRTAVIARTPSECPDPAAHRSGDRRLARRDRLGLDVQLHVVRHHEAAELERLVPGEAPRLAR